MCPWNAKFSRDAVEAAFTPRAELVAPDIWAFVNMDDAEFKARFGDTPLSRARRSGVTRNARTVLANGGGGDAVSVEIDHPDLQRGDSALE